MLRPVTTVYRVLIMHQALQCILSYNSMNWLPLSRPFLEEETERLPRLAKVTEPMIS